MKVPRAEFVAHLRSCTEDRAGFCTRITGDPGAETRLSVPKLCLEVAGMRDGKRRK